MLFFLQSTEIVCEWKTDKMFSGSKASKPVEPTPATEEECVEGCKKMRESNPRVNGIQLYTWNKRCSCITDMEGEAEWEYVTICYFEGESNQHHTRVFTRDFLQDLRLDTS